MTTPTQSITDDLLAEIEAGNIQGSKWALTPIVNRVRELEEVPRWIPVSDRLPLEYCLASVYSDITVIVTDGERVCEGDFQTGYGGAETGHWRAWGAYGEIKPGEVTHWMPLPEPPR